MPELTRTHFKTIFREGEFREGEAPAEPRFAAIPARREPRPPGFETGSSNTIAKLGFATIPGDTIANGERTHG